MSDQTPSEKAAVLLAELRRAVVERIDIIAAVLAAPAPVVASCEIYRLAIAPQPAPEANAAGEVERLRGELEAERDPKSVGNTAWLASRMQERAEKAEEQRDKLKSAIERYIHATRRMVMPFAKEGAGGFAAGGRLQSDSDQHGAAYADLLTAAGIAPMRREDLK